MTTHVAIVGRPNVGKSSLLNMLANRRVSIVDSTAGVTRDRIEVPIDLPARSPNYPVSKPIELIDTGGYGIEDVQNLTTQIEQQIACALADAHLVLLVVDAQTGIVPLDHAVARLLRTSDTSTPILVVANKVDGPTYEPVAYEAAKLGFGEPLMVSATSGRNKAKLIEAIHDHIDRLSVPQTGASISTLNSEALIAIAGKRNAGKSTFVNALAGEPRVIVSEVEGTTRDSIDVRFQLKGKTFTAIDTAGVRKTKSLAGDIEYYSYHRTLRSIRRADLVLLLIDTAVPISQVDRQLASEILKHHKPCVIVLNKWDLAQKDCTQELYIRYLDHALKGMRFAPIAFVSSVKKEGLRQTIDTGMTLYRQASHRVSTGELNRVMHQILAQKTPTSKIGRHPKIYYVTQLDTHPPTIGLFVNDPAQFDPGYERFLINRFRDYLPFAEVPIKLIIRGKRSAPTTAKTDLQIPAGSLIADKNQV